MNLREITLGPPQRGIPATADHRSGPNTSEVGQLQPAIPAGRSRDKAFSGVQAPG